MFLKLVRLRQEVEIAHQGRQPHLLLPLRMSHLRHPITMLGSLYQMREGRSTIKIKVKIRTRLTIMDNQDSKILGKWQAGQRMGRR